MTTLQRLLKYPHGAVFDKDPAPELAFRLRHSDGATWAVAERVMTATAGDYSWSYDLDGMTVADLVAALQSDGFTVLAINSGLAHLSAMVLVEGRGDQYESNGDHVMAFTSILWALMSAYSVEIARSAEQARQALRQMVIGQAEGEWLDVWGTLYGVARKTGELDAVYAPRLVRDVMRLRVNAHGIEQAILDETGWDVRIEEPWKELFILDQSLLSGPDRMYDGERYGYHLIRPVARVPIDRTKVRAIVERNRAAGVVVLEPVSEYGAYADASGISVASGRVDLRRSWTVYEDRALLDYMAIEDVSILNHELRHIRIVMHRSHVVVDSAQYAVDGAHSRTYRIHYGDSSYMSRYWMDQTWVKARGDWETTALIDTDHVSSS